MANKTIPGLPDYGSQDSDKIRKDLLEITKNDGTYASPSYPTGATRKITVEDLKTALAITSQTVTNGVTDKAPSEDAVFDAIYAKGLVKSSAWKNNGVGTFTLEADKYNIVNYSNTNIEILLPAVEVDKTIIVQGTTQNGSGAVNFTINNIKIGGADLGTPYSVTVTNEKEVLIFYGNYYGWHLIGHSNKTIDLSTKLDLDGGNANQDIDIDGFSLNAKHFKVNGTGGAGHIGLKHQSANITASGSESSIGANSVGDPVWKNDGGAIDKLELQSNKTGTVTGNEASTSKYLTVKGVYDWAVGLFPPKASPTFTGTVTTPDIVVSGATATTPTFFNATKNLISTTAQLWGTWVQTWASKATPVDADTIGFYNSASTFVGVKSTLLNLWTAYFKVKADALYVKLAGLTTNFIPYYNGSNLVDSTLVRSTNFIASSTQAIGGKTISGGNTAYTGRYNQASHPDYYGTDTMQAAILNTTAKGLHLYEAGLFMPYIQSSGWLSRSTGVQKYHDGQDFGGGSNPSWNYSGPYPEGVYHAYVSLNNATDTSEAYITVNGSGNVTNIDVTKPSSNITFSIVTNKVNIASATNIIAIFKYIGSSKTNSQLINLKYSSTGLASYWTGSEGLGVGHTSQNASAVLQADSTTKGFLPPRMTNTQRTNIVSPAIGLMVYCTDTIEGLYIYKSTGWTFII